MHFLGLSLSGGGAGATLEALGKSFAIIEFTPSGRILTANALFCATVGYSLAELKGKNHSLLVEPGYAQSQEYKAFWGRLSSGQFDTGEYLRLAKDGRRVWLQASYAGLRPGRQGGEGG